MHQIVDAAPTAEDCRGEKTNVTGWLRNVGLDFDNEKDSYRITTFEAARLDPSRMDYFTSYLAEYFSDRFICGQGTEHVLDLGSSPAPGWMSAPARRACSGCSQPGMAYRTFAASISFQKRSPSSRNSRDPATCHNAIWTSCQCTDAPSPTSMRSDSG